MEAVYEPFLPRNSKPFVYMSLSVHPHNIDVNVHPTKNEVRILHEDAIVDEIKTAIREVLEKSDSARSFVARSVAGGSAAVPIDQSQRLLPTVRAQEQAGALVRSEKNDQTGQLDKYLAQHQPGRRRVERESELEDLAPTRKKKKKKQVLAAEEQLISMNTLKANVVKEKHDGLVTIFKNHNYVGFINCSSSLIQYETKLYIVDTHALSVEVMYQLVLKNYKLFAKLKLAEATPILPLLRAYAECELEEGNQGHDKIEGTPDQFAKVSCFTC